MTTRCCRMLALIATVLVATASLAPLSRAQQPASAKAKVDQPAGATGATASTITEGPAPNLNNPVSLSLEQLIARIAASGRVLQAGESSSSRLAPMVRLAPGAPPILSFRYLDGQARHRFGDLDLVMDDAGH